MVICFDCSRYFFYILARWADLSYEISYMLTYLSWICVISTPVEINELKTEEAGNWTKNLRLTPTFLSWKETCSTLSLYNLNISVNTIANRMMWTVNGQNFFFFFKVLLATKKSEVSEFQMGFKMCYIPFQEWPRNGTC